LLLFLGSSKLLRAALGAQPAVARWLRAWLGVARGRPGDLGGGGRCWLAGWLAGCARPWWLVAARWAVRCCLRDREERKIYCDYNILSFYFYCMLKYNLFTVAAFHCKPNKYLLFNYLLLLGIMMLPRPAPQQ